MVNSDNVKVKIFVVDYDVLMTVYLYFVNIQK